MSRDWQKDFELCEKATPGPWRACGARDGCGLVWCVPGDVVVATTNTDDEDEGFSSTKESKVIDADFIAEAREALPYWLKRVRELEKIIEELSTEVKAWICDTCLTVFSENPVKGWDMMCPKCGKGVIMPKTTWERRELEKRIEALTHVSKRDD